MVTIGTSVLLVAATLAALWLAVRGFGSGRRAARTLRGLRRARGRPLSELRPGPAGVRGRVEVIDLLQSPGSDRQGVYIDHTLERWDSTPNMLGAAGKWVCADHLEEATPFELTDGRTTLHVNPEGAEVLVPRAAGRQMGDPPTRYTEAVIGAGQEVVVVGQIALEGGFDPSETYRGTTLRPVLARGDHGLLIATAGALRARLAGQLALAAGSALAAAAALVATAVWFGNLAPIIDVSLPGSAVTRELWPERYADGRYWRQRTADARPVGRATTRVWVLGWSGGGRVDHRVEQRLRRGLWRHHLNYVEWERTERGRAYLIFETTTRAGTAYTRPAFWKAFCELHPERCRDAGPTGQLPLRPISSGQGRRAPEVPALAPPAR